MQNSLSNLGIPAEWLPVITKLIIDLGLAILASVLILMVGAGVAGAARRWVRHWMIRYSLDAILVSFGGNVAYGAVFGIALIAALHQLGVQTTSIVAALGASGVAIGLALRDSLANFAAGLLIVMLRPFRLGDFIEGGGTTGVVQDIQMFSTLLTTPQNQEVVVPNAKLLNDNIVNYTSAGRKRVDLEVGIGYGEEVPAVKALLYEILRENSLVLSDPEPLVAVMTFGDSSVNLVVRAWVASAADYWTVHFGLLESIKQRFDAAGIEIPFPKSDVNLYTHTPGSPTPESAA
jgi:small conductance mechanosensitive channel